MFNIQYFTSWLWVTETHFYRIIYWKNLGEFRELKSLKAKLGLASDQAPWKSSSVMIALPCHCSVTVKQNPSISFIFVLFCQGPRLPRDRKSVSWSQVTSWTHKGCCSGFLSVAIKHWPKATYVGAEVASTADRAIKSIPHRHIHPPSWSGQSISSDSPLS